MLANSTPNEMLDLLHEHLRGIAPEPGRKIDATLQIAMTDVPAMSLYFAVDGGAVDVQMGRHDAPTATVSTSLANFMEMVTHGLSRASDLISSQQIDISGQLDAVSPLLFLLLPEKVVTPTSEQRARLEARTLAGRRLDAIDRCDRAAARQLIPEYAERSLPLLITDYVEGWDVRSWNLSDIRGRLGERLVFARNCPPPPAYWEERLPILKLTVAEYIDKHLETSSGSTLPYVEFFDVPEEFEAFLQAPPYFAAEHLGRPKMWLGPAGTVTPLHRDWSDNIFVQLYGRKRFVLYPPDQSRYFAMVSTRTHDWSPVDLDDVNLELYPQVSEAVPLEFVVEQGQALFIPAGWLHHVRSLATSFSVNYFVDGQLARAVAVAS